MREIIKFKDLSWFNMIGVIGGALFMFYLALMIVLGVIFAILGVL